MVYEFGQNVTFEATFIDSTNGNLIDPVVVNMRIYYYASSVLVEAVPMTAMERVGTGRYILNVTLGLPNFSIGGNYFTEVSGYIDLVSASAATLTGSQIEDFKIQTGINDTFIVALDGNSPLTTVLTAGAGLHAVATGTTTENFNFNADLPARDIGSVTGPFSIQAGINDQLRVAANLGSLQVITLPVGNVITIGEVVNQINSQAVDFIAVNYSGALQLQTIAVGSPSKLFIGGGNANGTFGFVTDSTFYGQDNNLVFKVSIDSGPEQVFTFTPGTLDANGVVSVLGSGTNFTPSNSVGKVRLTNTTVNIGYRSVIDIGNGTASATLGFTPLTTIRGVPGRLAQDIADEINAIFVVGTPASVVNGKLKLTSSTTGVTSSVQIAGGNANSTLGFTPMTVVGSDELKEFFLNTEGFIVVEQIAPALAGLNATVVG